MLMIRLQRVGRKNDPSFRIVITDSKNGPKSGKFLEVVGAYDARKGQPQIKADRIKYWLSVGAQVSDTVHNLLVKNKVIEGKTIAPFILKPKEAAPEPVAGVPAEVLTEEGEVKEETPAQTVEAVEEPVAG